MDHGFYIRRCLELASKGAGRTSPNPIVGAVIVRDGKIVTEGFHRKAGLSHAEVEAIRSVGATTGGCPDTTLYVNLEPCCHHGRTPPCTSAILKSGIRRVVVGVVDPNPKVAGKGIALLRKNGVKVTVGVMAEECRRANEAYFKFITTGRPFVILKVAATLDGMVATQEGEARWITSTASRREVHRLRDRVDAILVGANTVARDNPRLTTRLPGRKGHDPIRIILDSHLYADPDAAVFDKGDSPRKGRSMIATVEPLLPERRRLFEKKGVEILICRKKPDGPVDLADLLDRLGQKGITSLLLEGGPTVHSSFLRERLVDKFMTFYSPRFLGGTGLPMFSGLTTHGLKGLPTLENLSCKQIGPDLLVTGYPC